MPKKKTPAEKPKDQFKRFVETAKELEVDQSGKPLNDAFSDLSADGRKASRGSRNKAEAPK